MPEQIELIDSSEVQVTCDHCSEETTEDNIENCPNCSSEHCENCNTTCADCSTEICNDCAVNCEGCSDPCCADCIVSCDDCSSSGCNSCMNLTNCSECSSELCEDCYYYCDDNDCCYCRSCYDNRSTDYDLSDFHREILDYETTVKWDLFKEKHENTIFLGIELETSFNHSDVEKMFDASEIALNGKHVWKYDSSINDGAELVIAPHT